MLVLVLVLVLVPVPVPVPVSVLVLALVLVPGERPPDQPAKPPNKKNTNAKPQPTSSGAASVSEGQGLSRQRSFSCGGKASGIQRQKDANAAEVVYGEFEQLAKQIACPTLAPTVKHKQVSGILGKMLARLGSKSHDGLDLSVWSKLEAARAFLADLDRVMLSVHAKEGEFHYDPQLLLDAIDDAGRHEFRLAITFRRCMFDRVCSISFELALKVAFADDNSSVTVSDASLHFARLEHVMAMQLGVGEMEEGPLWSIRSLALEDCEAQNAQAQQLAAQHRQICNFKVDPKADPSADILCKELAVTSLWLTSVVALVVPPGSVAELFKHFSRLVDPFDVSSVDLHASVVEIGKDREAMFSQGMRGPFAAFILRRATLILAAKARDEQLTKHLGSLLAKVQSMKGGLDSKAELYDLLATRATPSDFTRLRASMQALYDRVAELKQALGAGQCFFPAVSDERILGYPRCCRGTID